jgi:hypothetical protein
MFRRPLTLAAIAIMSACMAVPATATTLTLVTGNTTSMLPGTSGSMTLSMANDAGNVTNFNGWVLGVQFLPAAGTTGTVSLTGLLAPTSNAAVTNNPAAPVYDPDLELFDVNSDPLFINGSNLFTSLSITSALSSNTQTIAGSSTVNLGIITFTASADAAGTWNIFAINPNADDGERSYWYTNGLNSNSYGNLLLPASGQPAASILLGTVTVQAVPEPSTISLAGFAVAAAGWTAFRRSRRSRS